MKRAILRKTVGLFLELAIFIIFFGCKQAQKVADILSKPTPRELYARQFEKDTILFASWEKTFTEALKDSLRIELPYSENGIFFSQNTMAYSYNLPLLQGEILHIAYVWILFLYLLTFMNKNSIL